jgi:hypothetical protein
MLLHLPTPQTHENAQAFANTDEEELLLNTGRKKMWNPEDQYANRSEKSSFKPVESDQFPIGPRMALPAARTRARN